MHYSEFKNEVTKYMSTHLSDECTIEVRELVKNNNTVYDAMVICDPRCNVSPTIYLQPYYHRMLEGVSLSDILEDIWQTYSYHRPNIDIDIDFFTDYEKVQDNIIIKVINYEKNRTFLEDVPHRRFLDLAVVFQYLAKELIPGAGSGTITITHSQLEMWKVPVDQLLRDALKNTPRLLPPLINEISEMLKQLVPKEVLQNLAEEEELPLDLQIGPNMFVMTNDAKTHGASTILYPGLLSTIASHLDSDLYLLPSSIHEFILIPCEDPDDTALLTHLSEMVVSVNETELSDDEILGDQAYLYKRSDNKVYESRKLIA